MPRDSALALRSAAVVLIASLLAAGGAEAAEYGTGPWVKGYSDIFAGVVPSEPGLYVRNDLYHYNGSADRVIFNGRVQLGVQEEYDANIFALTYVTSAKILGGTYGIAIAPSLVDMHVGVSLGIPRFTTPTGLPRGIPAGVPLGPFSPVFGDELFALGDTAFAPLVLGWNEGNFHWNVALFGFAPTGDYELRRLANTSLHHWAVMPRFAATYFDPKSGWQASGAAIYSWNFENPATDYETGNILNLEGSITKNFGPVGVGAVAYAMIQTTGDSGAGAKLGSFESRVYGVGPILSLTLGGTTAAPITLLLKGYHEFDAENTFEGEVVDGAVSFKF